MRKLLTFFAAAAVLTGTGMSLSAQEYIPENEITINVFGGANLGMMNVSGAYRADDPGFLPAFGAGLGYIHHFNEHWGFLTGIDAALYKFKASSTDPDFVDITSGMAYDIRDDAGGTVKSMRLFRHFNFSETAQLGSLQIPLMLQFKAPLSERVHFYAAGGATLALNLYGKYVQKIDKLEMTDVLTEGLQVTSLIPDTDITGRVYEDNSNIKGDFDRNMFDVKASAELGFRWALSAGVGLYTGVFADYGFLAAFADKDYSILSDGSDKTGGAWNDINSFETHSIFNSKTAPKPEVEMVRYTVSGIDGNVGKSYIDPLRAGMAGLKVRLSFGKARKAPKPEPAPVAVPAPTVVYVPAKADTVTKVVVVKDTVTVEKVKVVEKIVRDTVTVIKEVPVEIQRVMKDLSNTLFAFNKFDLNDKAKGYLDEVADWLKKNEDLKIEIAGHTDGIGGEEYNQKLSESRAKEVYTYFVEHGVKPGNLSYKGYGKSQPIATNNTDEGRQQNRRVELKILK